MTVPLAILLLVIQPHFQPVCTTPLLRFHAHMLQDVNTVFLTLRRGNASSSSGSHICLRDTVHREIETRALTIRIKEHDSMPQIFDASLDHGESIDKSFVGQTVCSTSRYDSDPTSTRNGDPNSAARCWTYVENDREWPGPSSVPRKRTVWSSFESTSRCRVTSGFKSDELTS